MERTEALVIVDMQKVAFTVARYNSDNVIRRIAALASKFRKQNKKIIFIQHNGEVDGYCYPNTEEWKIVSELPIYPEDIIIEKKANDSFYKTNFEKVLKQHSIEKLYFTGCATDFCVDATVKTALTKDYDITIVSDCHTTADRPSCNAKTLIDFYNWLWADLTQTKYKIKVIPAAEI
ncbi:isochorismatase family protein [uncultured Bacteroides sp.]|uniref:isochorismatase family protein n=1 Tax=uncultured Bacteroides sp. TaxID=162156 RepID=UPI002AAB197B|nr:isochorismatase family protein [uncultured Bacteroides sp.]